MFSIISNGEVIAYCDQPRYIKLKVASGAFIQTDKDSAQGIAVKGIPFNLHGHQEITRIEVNEETGAAEKVIVPEAFVSEIDGGEIVFDDGNKIVEIDDSVTNTQLALCEVYELLMGGE